MTTFLDWVREHRRMSVYTMRRRFPISRAEAEGMMAQLVSRGKVDPEPEGDSYAVREPRAPAPTQLPGDGRHDWPARGRWPLDITVIVGTRHVGDRRDTMIVDCGCNGELSGYHLDGEPYIERTLDIGFCRLHAEAPALLAALEEARRIVNHCPPGGVPEQEKADWYASANAAIAQAKEATA